jgi:hypothetical protein
MGIDSADYDRDGFPDIVKTNFSDDTNNLYHNDGSREFTDLAGSSGFGPISVPFLGFGTKFLDVNNDGWQDIFVTNGHVNPQVDRHSFGVSYAERPLLFKNRTGGKFVEVGLRSGLAMSRRYVGRGAATADFWNRGASDVLLSTLDGRPVLLQNQTVGRGHWLRLHLVGTRSNRDAFGAKVEATAGGTTQTAEVRANSSFESASDPRLLLGLGSSTRVDSIRVTWPSGTVERFGPFAVDREATLKEGEGTDEKLENAHKQNK